MQLLFAWLTVGLASKSVFVTIQIIVATALVLAHIVLLGFVLYAIAFVYNAYNSLLELVVNMSAGSELLGIAMKVLQSLGVINAFNDVFAIFSPFIIGYLVYVSGLMIFHSFQATSNEIFKVGVLTQQ